MLGSSPLSPTRYAAAASSCARCAPALGGAGLSQGGGRGLGPDGKPREAVPGEDGGQRLCLRTAADAMAVEAGPELAARVAFPAALG